MTIFFCNLIKMCQGWGFYFWGFPVIVVAKMASFGELRVFRFYEHMWLFVQVLSHMRTFWESRNINVKFT